MEELKERKDIAEEYTWDLSSLYKSDAEWEEAFVTVDPFIEELASYQGKLKDVDTIHAYITKSIEAERLFENLFTYASLRRSEDMRTQEAQQMYARIYGKYVQYMTAVSFMEPEILALPQETLEEFSKDPKLKDFAFNLQQMINRKPHVLSGEQEELLARFGEVLGAPGEIANILQDADMVFDSVKDGNDKDIEVTGSNFIALESSDDRTLRKNAFHSFYKGYKQHINTFASAYSANVKAFTAEASARKYASSRDMSLSHSHIPLEVYDNLVDTVRKHLDTMYRYVALRKKLLGVDELHYYDVYAPLVGTSEKRYSYEEAQQMVLKAVSPFGNQYQDTVRSAFADRWIDVYPNKGKAGGAYSSGTYDSYPYIMTNFTGTLDSVSTIAHEMGHSMHTWYSKNTQPPQYAGYTLFVAEVASTVNENLLIEQLLKETTDPKERLIYLNQYLEGFKGTVFRQTMFAEFEKEAHAMAEKGLPLDTATLNELYRKLIVDYFGPELVLDEEVSYEWSRIPHFYRPFYVYVYATGYTSAVALSEGILKNGQPAVDRYLEFLSMGGSQYPLDELKHAGVDLATPQPIETALEKFARVLDDAEETAKKL